MSVGKEVRFAAEPDGDNTSVPITSPRFDLAPDALVAPVPPDPITNVEDKPAAVPVVFWFSVGKVQFARFPDVGVPKIGVVSDGLVDKTLLPEPVEEVTPVPPLATGKVPVTSVVNTAWANDVFVPSDLSSRFAVCAGASALKAALAVT